MRGRRALQLQLDALGRRLTDMANLDKGEFDFDQEPALGGPFSPEPASLGGSELGETLRQPRVWLSVGLFFVYVGGEVALVGVLKEIEDLQARIGRLEADAFQVLGVVGHGGLGGVGDDVSLKLATRGGTGGHARRSQDPAYVIFFTPF